MLKYHHIDHSIHKHFASLFFLIRSKIQFISDQFEENKKKYMCNCIDIFVSKRRKKKLIMYSMHMKICLYNLRF